MPIGGKLNWRGKSPNFFGFLGPEIMSAGSTCFRCTIFLYHSCWWSIFWSKCRISCSDRVERHQEKTRLWHDWWRLLEQLTNITTTENVIVHPVKWLGWKVFINDLFCLAITIRKHGCTLRRALQGMKLGTEWDCASLLPWNFLPGSQLFCIISSLSTVWTFLSIWQRANKGGAQVNAHVIENGANPGDFWNKLLHRMEQENVCFRENWRLYSCIGRYRCVAAIYKEIKWKPNVRVWDSIDRFSGWIAKLLDNICIQLVLVKCCLGDFLNELLCQLDILNMGHGFLRSWVFRESLSGERLKVFHLQLGKAVGNISMIEDTSGNRCEQAMSWPSELVRLKWRYCVPMRDDVNVRLTMNNKGVNQLISCIEIQNLA